MKYQRKQQVKQMGNVKETRLFISKTGKKKKIDEEFKQYSI